MKSGQKIWLLWFVLMLPACQKTPVRQSETLNADPLSAAIELQRYQSASPVPQSEDDWTRKIADKFNRLQHYEPNLGAKEFVPDLAVEHIKPCDAGSFALRELALESVVLSNQDVPQAVDVLKAIGYHAFSADSRGAEELRRYDCDELPVVMAPTAVANERTSIDKHLKQHTNVSEIDQLLVFYHPDRIDALQRLKSTIRSNLDLAAPQVYIEGLVLEISDVGLKELGVRFERMKDQNAVGVGALEASATPVTGTNVFSFVRDTAKQLENRLLLQIQALISEGEAEILSRPSVLTVSNRQAVIQVVDNVQYPEFESQVSSSGELVGTTVRFQEITPGITLNLRPRVAAGKKEVSLEIDIEVKALVTANNAQAAIGSGENKVTVTKPGSSTRKVQTFARIPDRTPIIIGGLVSTDKEIIENKFPFLGDLPVLGHLFGAERKTFAKREVIIVLTPHILVEEDQAVEANLPKDSGLFDQEGMTLFRDSYRIRSEDVFDLEFVYEDPTFRKYQAWAQWFVERTPELANQHPYKWFVDNNIPGGDALVGRVLYDIVAKKRLEDRIDAKQIFVLRGKKEGGSDAETIDTWMNDLLGKSEPGRVLVIAFTRPAGTDTDVDFSADIYFEKLPAGQSVFAYSWELAQEREKGIDRFAIVIRNKSDYFRLLRSLIASHVLQLNGGEERLTIERFRRGRILGFPVLEQSRQFMIDAKVAKVFFNSIHYHAAALQSLSKTYRDLDEALQEFNSAATKRER